MDLVFKVAYTAFNLWVFWMLVNKFLKTYHDTSEIDIVIMICAFVLLTALIYKDWWG